MRSRPSWGGQAAQRLTAATLARDYVPSLGYAPCHWCGKPANTADHHPIARVDGGPDDLSNLVAACLPCNASRGATLGNYRRYAPKPSRDW